MPSKIVAQVSKIENIRNHPNADRLEICEINGWQLVCGLGSYKNNDRVVYITPDSLVTAKLADVLNITQYLSSVKNQDGSFVTNSEGETMMRVKQAKLRGELSFGTTIPNEICLEYFGIDLNELKLGDNIAERIGVLKYEPHMRTSAGDAEQNHPLFIKYTSIGNLRNYPKLLKEGELINVSLKIHGTNSRIGSLNGKIMAGSHSVRRKQPDEKSMETNTYWFPYTIDSVKNFLNNIGKKYKQVILYGEIYGNIQKKYNYGISNGIGFRAFDIMINGKFLNQKDFYNYCKEYEIETTPLLIENFKYNYRELVDFVNSIDEDPLGNHPIEGVVLTPIEERHDSRLGRVKLKYISDKFLFDNKKTDFKDY